MAHSKTVSSLYEIDGDSLTLMKLQGMHFSQKNWAIGVSLVGDDNYFLAEVSPAPALDDVLRVIQQDIDAGNYAKIRAIVVSNRVAVRLWLDGTLKVQDFHSAKEGEVQKPEMPFIAIAAVQVGPHTFPVVIVPETKVGASMVATIDSNFKIVGSGEDEPPALVIGPGFMNALPSGQEKPE